MPLNQTYTGGPIMRDWAQEKERRVAFIKKMLASSGAKGVVFGNSGGKDSALVAALCSFATDNVLGVIMPCHSKRNFGEDKEDGLAVAEKYGVETMVVDLTEVREKLLAAVGGELTALDRSRRGAVPLLPRPEAHVVDPPRRSVGLEVLDLAGPLRAAEDVALQ